MRKIILTGYSKNGMRKSRKRNMELFCYICKREDNDKGVFLSKDDRHCEPGLQELYFQMLEVVRGDTKFNFLLCHECSLLLEGFVENIGKVNLSLAKHSSN